MKTLSSLAIQLVAQTGATMAEVDTTTSLYLVNGVGKDFIEDLTTTWRKDFPSSAKNLKEQFKRRIQRRVAQLFPGQHLFIKISKNNSTIELRDLADGQTTNEHGQPIKAETPAVIPGVNAPGEDEEEEVKGEKSSSDDSSTGQATTDGQTTETNELELVKAELEIAMAKIRRLEGDLATKQVIIDGLSQAISDKKVTRAGLIAQAEEIDFYQDFTLAA